MITHLDVLNTWATRWKSLAAWRAPLDVGVTIKPRPAHVVNRLGTAHCADRKATVYATGDLTEDLCTILHELAHLAAPRWTRHEMLWRMLYLAAVVEATQRPGHLFDPNVTIVDLDAQVVSAIDAWLTKSGQRAVLQAVGVLK
jgi:hypothetical protein